MRNEEILKKTEEGMRESNKVLIRELVQDLEERGIIPVWAIDGEARDLKKENLKTALSRTPLIEKSEIEDLEKELEEHGLKDSDFCILAEDRTKYSPNSLHQITGNIIIIHKKSAKLRQYKAGNGSHWVSNFHRDLENKFFTN